MVRSSILLSQNLNRWQPYFNKFKFKSKKKLYVSAYFGS